MMISVAVMLISGLALRFPGKYDWGSKAVGRSAAISDPTRIETFVGNSYTAAAQRRKAHDFAIIFSWHGFCFPVSMYLSMPDQESDE